MFSFWFPCILCLPSVFFLIFRFRISAPFDTPFLDWDETQDRVVQCAARYLQFTGYHYVLADPEVQEENEGSLLGTVSALVYAQHDDTHPNHALIH